MTQQLSHNKLFLSVLFIIAASFILSSNLATAASSTDPLSRNDIKKYKVATIYSYGLPKAYAALQKSGDITPDLKLCRTGTVYDSFVRRQVKGSYVYYSFEVDYTCPDFDADGPSFAVYFDVKENSKTKAKSVINPEMEWFSF